MSLASPDTLVRDARDRYLAENGFTLAAYHAPIVRIDLPLGFPVWLPNTKDRKKAVPLHDLHHVATGYRADITGEAQIGAWELASGCTNATLYAYNGLAAVVGLVVAPVRTVRAFMKAREQRQRTLYLQDVAYDELLAMTVGELRARLGLPREGAAAS